jgi:hypothetical protein
LGTGPRREGRLPGRWPGLFERLDGGADVLEDLAELGELAGEVVRGLGAVAAEVGAGEERGIDFVEDLLELAEVGAEGAQDGAETAEARRLVSRFEGGEHRLGDVGGLRDGALGKIASIPKRAKGVAEGGLPDHDTNAIWRHALKQHAEDRKPAKGRWLAGS